MSQTYCVITFNFCKQLLVDVLKHLLKSRVLNENITWYAGREVKNLQITLVYMKCV